MDDTDDLRAPIEDVIPDIVKQAFAEEAEFIRQRVIAHRNAGESIIQKALTWVPYVDEVFEEQEINVAAACSDVNREQRVKIVVGKIERGLGCTLGPTTVGHIREDIYTLYNTDIKVD